MSFAADPIRDKNELKALADFYFRRGELRNYVLVVLGVHTALRISDLLQLKWTDLYDYDRGCMRDHLAVVEQKTGKRRIIALNREALRALSLYFKHHKGEYVFSNHRKHENHISRVQAWRILRAAVKALRLTGHISCHSLRKTWGYFAWSRAGISPEVIMTVFNHSDFRITLRYLGVQQDDLDQAYRKMKMF